MMLKRFSLLIFFCTAIMVSGQDKSFSQEINPFDSNYVPATVYLRNGSSLEGLSKIRENAIQQFVLFKSDKKGKKVKYDHRNLSYVIFHHDDYNEKHEYKIMKSYGKAADRGDIALVRNLVDGDVKLFFRYTLSDGFGGVKREFFYSTDEDNFIVKLPDNTNSVEFKKLANTLFGDCLDLYQKVMNEYFKKNDVMEVFEYYFDNCKKNK